MEDFTFFIPYLVVLILILLVIGLGVWSVLRVVRTFRSGNTRVGWIQLGVLAAIVLPLFWYLEILPLSRNVRFMKEAEDLTGQRFWGWKDESIDEPSVRGEGYWLEIFSISEEVAQGFMDPPPAFFTHKPESEWILRRRWSGWKRCPIAAADSLMFDTATPLFAGWSSSKEDVVKRIKRWGLSEDCWYAYAGGFGSVYLYMINPAERAMAIIYSNP